MLTRSLMSIRMLLVNIKVLYLVKYFTFLSPLSHMVLFVPRLSLHYFSEHLWTWSHPYEQSVQKHLLMTDWTQSLTSFLVFVYFFIFFPQVCGAQRKAWSGRGLNELNGDILLSVTRIHPVVMLRGWQEIIVTGSGCYTLTHTHTLTDTYICSTVRTFVV